ncbi:ABC transporter substrate-binding protein [Pseudoroseicyclus sp. H15]
MKHLLSSTFLLSLVATGAAAQDTQITFSLWGSPQEGEVWEQIAEAFEAEHPDIDVNIEVADWDGYWEKLRVQVAGGTPPDVFAMDAPLYPDWQSRDVLLNMQPYIDAEPGLLDGVFPVTLEAYKTDEGLFGLPRDFQTIVLFYNKDMFDEAGVDYPTADWSWDDFRSTAAELTIDKDGDGTIDQWGAWAEVYDMEPFWGPVVLSHGGQIVDPEAGETLLLSDGAVEGFEFIRELWLDDKSMPTEQQLSQYGWDGLLSGVAAMGFSGHWSVPEYSEAGLNLGIVPVPAGPEGRVTLVNSAGFVISKDTPNPDAAWEFVQFAISEAGQSALAEIGLSVPILESVASSDAYLGQEVQLNHQLFVDALDYATPKPSFRGYEEWSGAVGDALGLAWNDGEDLDYALEEAVAYGDEALARNR